MTLIVPKMDDFENGILSIEFAFGKTFIMNHVDVGMRSGGKSVEFDSFNVGVLIEDSEGATTYIPCPCVVGFENEYVAVKSDDPALLGSSLNKSNIGSVYIEVNA